MSQQDYYDVLGVSKSSTKNEIKRAYKKLAMKYHPDKNKDNPKAEEQFKKIAEAYSVLSDDQKKAQYDQFGHAGFEGGQAGAQGFNDFADILKDFLAVISLMPFKAVVADDHLKEAEHRMVMTSYELTITLEEAAKGCEKSIRIPNIVNCDTCHGSGAKPGTKPKVCPTCHGQGQVRMQQGFMAFVQTCPTCHGRGEVISDPCSSCRGKGRIRKQCQHNIKIPKGIDHGNRVRYKGKGEAGAYGGENGDLYIAVSIKQHELFSREGQDLHCEVPICFPTAALGGSVEVVSILGESLILEIPKKLKTIKY